MAKYPISVPATTLFGGAPVVPINSNYDFETGISPWTPISGTTQLAQSSQFAFTGTFSMRMTSTTVQASIEALSENTVAVSPGVQYTASVRAFSQSSGTPISNGQIVIAWQNAAHGAISNSASASVPIGLNVTPGWTTISVTATAPATAAFAQIQIIGTTGITNGQMWVDYAAMNLGSGIPGALNTSLVQVSVTPPPHTLYEVFNVGIANTSAVNKSVCQIFIGSIPVPANYVGATQNNNDQILLSSPVRVSMGNSIIAQWTGGDVGAVGTMTVYGNRISGYRGNPNQ